MDFPVDFLGLEPNYYFSTYCDYILHQTNTLSSNIDWFRESHEMIVLEMALLLPPRELMTVKVTWFALPGSHFTIQCSTMLPNISTFFFDKINQTPVWNFTQVSIIKSSLNVLLPRHGLKRKIDKSFTRTLFVRKSCLCYKTTISIYMAQMCLLVTVLHTELFDCWMSASRSLRCYLQPLLSLPFGMPLRQVRQSVKYYIHWQQICLIPDRRKRSSERNREGT